jgi:hypothetical protein
MSGPYASPFDGNRSSGGGEHTYWFVAFLTALTETAASAAGAAAAAIAAAQEAEQLQQQAGSGAGFRGQQGLAGEGLELRLPSPGMVEFYKAYERYVEGAALPSWWLKVRIM